AQRDAWIEAIDFPPDTRRDEPVAVTVRVVSESSTRAMLRLRSGDDELGQRVVQLAAGANQFVFHTRIRHSGAVDLDAEVRAQGDSVPENDRLTLTAWIAPRARVLYAEGQGDSARFLKDALLHEGIDVTVATGAQLPHSARELAGFQAVILSDVPRSALDDAQMRAVQDYVRDQGGGFLYAGGETTYGQPGFAHTRLGNILPVELKEQE